MEQLIVNGPTRLEGTIPVSGCKNAVLPIAVAAAILGDSVSVLRNVPDLTDVATLRAGVGRPRCRNETERFNTLYPAGKSSGI